MYKIHPKAYDEHPGPGEILVLLGLIQHHKCRRLLEIGSRYGSMLLLWSDILPKGSMIRAIDLPSGEGMCEEGNESILAVMEECKGKGIDAKLHEGNSRDPVSVAWARAEGPYDLVFIDGEHSEEALAADWKNYNELAPIIAIHDIGKTSKGMWVAWNKIRGQYKKSVTVFARNKQVPGLGVIWKD